jgi:class 4 POU domain transcription factor
MRKLAILAVMAALTVTLSGCWWGPGPGWGGGPGHGGGPGGGPGGDGPHGAVVVPHATARA